VFKFLLNPKYSLFVVLFHVLLGVITIFTNWPLIIWVYLFFITSFFSTIRRAQLNDLTLFSYFISYILSFEFINRLAKTSPYIPYELGKYLLLFLCPIFIIISPKKPFTLGFILLLLIFPAIFYDFSGERVFVDIVYNLFAPIGLAFAVILWGSYKTNIENFNNILRLIWLSCISGLVFTFLRTPDFDDINFTIEANFATTADGSTNQVATILGIGMFISIYAWYKKLKFSGVRILDAFWGMLFAFQGFLTFSRGGMITGILAIILLIYLDNYRNTKTAVKFKFSYIGYLILSLLILSFVFSQVNSLSGGKLGLRYLGETEGTYRGTQEKSLSKVTSGRNILFIDDFKLWTQYPITGVGAGSSMYMRAKFGIPIPPHIELSRLFSEHGLFGIFYFIFLLRLGWLIWKSRINYDLRNILFVLFCIAILTSFHSAMRTYITPLFIGLSTMFGRK
jgi:hypothetical protein